MYHSTVTGFPPLEKVMLLAETSIVPATIRGLSWYAGQARYEPSGKKS